MGLPARQEKALERIESALQESDPNLAALYATFARLTGGEDIPRIEERRQPLGFLLAALHQMARVMTAALRLRRVTRRRSAVLFFPLAVMVAMTSIVLAVRPGSAPSCASVRSVAAAKFQARHRLCPLSPAVYGH